LYPTVARFDRVPLEKTRHFLENLPEEREEEFAYDSSDNHSLDVSGLLISAFFYSEKNVGFAPPVMENPAGRDNQIIRRTGCAAPWSNV